ncbi:aromatic acid exporter family protein [Corynebacterium sp. sy017]|uniref:FUSC family protein n=1 Tax=unclassified Corynebacterium TaxID=2624378 RepID=UPI0011850A10|nr:MULTISPECIES: FUSC family protein [unclassified Corynebacterium]MBP3088432.1 aromatic acid exporter family protein [Corynebacterium sp. sy017]QDZ43458.1 aromatic acid exporter family protein [Corynebacterium sp. sy039]TSD92087.1 aromatic acid exporter family protein [Corynebacterium sp. SY003]
MRSKGQISRTYSYLRGWDKTLQSRVRRVRYNLVSILQSALAAGIAFWVATDILGHARPFFAPMAAIIILGLSSGARIKRAIELSIGCSMGVALGDIIIMTIGTGHWQLGLTVFLALLVANFLSNAQLLMNQVAIGTILIATIMPPGSEDSVNRVIDALVGCGVGIVVMALIPHSPLAGGRREVAKVLQISSTVLADVAQGLKTNDGDLIGEAIRQVRGSQGNINAMLDAAKSGEEDTKVSPLLWASRRRVKSLIRILVPVDNSIRNTRVLARRAQVLVQDGDTVTEEQIDIIEELSEIVTRLHDLFLRPGEVLEAVEIPELTRNLRYLGARCSLDVAAHKVLSAQVILAQSRSIIVDLLQICGMSRESAVAVLSPTTQQPAYPPELWHN